MRRLTIPCLCLLLLGAMPSHAATPQPLDSIVVIVNDDVILKTDLDRRERTIKQQLQERGTGLPPEEALRKQVLERLVVDELQLQLAAQNNIKVDDAALNHTLQKMAAQNKLSMAQFRDTLEHSGFDFTSFREDIRNEMIMARLRNRQVGNHIDVSEREVDNFLANQASRGDKDSQYHFAHILVATPEGATPEQIKTAETKASDILDRLHRGADFQQLAVSVSDGQNALEGGDLGWRSFGELPSLIADIAPGMKVGDVSDLLRSPSGFHIVKLLESKGSGTTHVVPQTHARHILIKTNELTSDQSANQRLEGLRTRIEGGDDFAELARANSEDAGSAAKGGDLGWVAPGALVPQFQEVMDSLAPGQVSKPFKTQFGWHIVQVLGRRQRDDTTEYKRAKARAQIRERKYEEELEAWIRRLRDEAYVEYRLDGAG